MRRAKAALAVAKHHEAQAKKEKAKAWQLARTWGFYIVDDAVATELPTDPLDFRG